MSFDDLRRIDGLTQTELDRLAARARAALAWRQTVEAMRAEGEVDGVRVTVNGTGSLVDLRIPTAACADGGDALAGRVSEAITRARVEVARLAARSGAETFGEDSPEAATIRASWDDGARHRPQVVAAETDRREDPRPPSGPPPASPPPGTW
ncbi:YbaB/EbfC family nucleoid-associated protein [Nostocoides sp. Soil756]|uniref:YbaB/EbfC family nucleoid-associated protein n=1 Tax=Nostocoides sp. Soil756 TaxID=1736399 RepID=UPI000700F966|nr:YbaB/EbfC family nucleoid-associated protein [Tetrasphaera sp. Soil756]KRE61335.1 hypothetical protein ASG78_13555 [Tetrasphaera sp. Soil756]